MKVIIAGSRGITSFMRVKSAIEESGFDITEVVSGCAMGVDRLGERWANINKIKVVRFAAEWATLGKRAGFVRNEKMARYADALVAIHDGQSRGTAHMIETAEQVGLKVFVKTVLRII